MNHASTKQIRHPVAITPATLWPGIGLTAVLAVISMTAATNSFAQQHALSSLTLAIMLGVVVGNTVFSRIAAQTAHGVDFSRGSLLRLGVMLYGFRVSFQDLAHVGLTGLAMAALVVAGIFSLSRLLGTRVFRLDRETSMLIGAGAAICGAAAVMAAEPVIRGQAHKVSVAVATVVVFGSLGMFLYPTLYPYLGLSEHAYGIYAGATIHEVAQVVVAGKAVGDGAAAAAVIEKMLRVMLLAPFLLTLSVAQRKRGALTATGAQHRITVPWFALGFIAVSGLNSMQILPPAWTLAITRLDTALLCMAMAALGLRTHVGAIRQAGVRPLLLAATLFVTLLIGGWALSFALFQLHAI
ncbi:YeiH family putative sulfate export transporter [Sinimarinibacterium sp. CAU 1509]|uniref:YeiH family protein n=1 Tax=Sinimarinibacterium sp. CAU 1509 TaxID=2562283 RepID=UPI0010AC2395|nr:YeiH family protein [Sinimarinibacterium sp. CAU 1509]TJY62981.1 YeiH family putative sulfate export transporter [Sinimarinibacterium sp. CAU 1509]